MVREFTIVEQSIGHVMVDVPNNISGEEADKLAYDKAYEAYTKGEVYWFDERLSEIQDKTAGLIYEEG